MRHSPTTRHGPAAADEIGHASGLSRRSFHKNRRALAGWDDDENAVEQAARVAARGPEALTLSGVEGARFAAESNAGTIIPIHYEGWAHFSQDRTEVEEAFAQAHLEQRLLWLPLGQPVTVAS